MNTGKYSGVLSSLQSERDHHATVEVAEEVVGRSRDPVAHRFTVCVRVESRENAIRPSLTFVVVTRVKSWDDDEQEIHQVFWWDDGLRPGLKPMRRRTAPGLVVRRLAPAVQMNGAAKRQLLVELYALMMECINEDLTRRSVA